MGGGEESKLSNPAPQTASGFQLGSFFYVVILLAYSRLTMLCEFQGHSKVSQLYIRISIFVRFFSHTGYENIE